MTLTADQRWRNEQNNRIKANFRKKKSPVTQEEIEVAKAKYKAGGGVIEKIKHTEVPGLFPAQPNPKAQSNGGLCPNFGGTA